MNWRPAEKTMMGKYAEKTMLGKMPKKYGWAKCRKNMRGPNAENIWRYAKKWKWNFYIFGKWPPGEQKVLKTACQIWVFLKFSIFSQLQIFKLSLKRHHELNLEKRVPGSRSKVNLEPRRPVSWTFCFLWNFVFWLVAYVYMHLQLFVPFPGG